MTVEIPSNLQEFVKSVVAGGGFRSEADVISEALTLLKEREQLRRDVRAGFEQLDRGERIDGEEVFERLRKKAAALASKS